MRRTDGAALGSARRIRRATRDAPAKPCGRMQRRVRRRRPECCDRHRGADAHRRPTRGRLSNPAPSGAPRPVQTRRLGASPQAARRRLFLSETQRRRRLTIGVQRTRRDGARSKQSRRRPPPEQRRPWRSAATTGSMTGRGQRALVRRRLAEAPRLAGRMLGRAAGRDAAADASTPTAEQWPSPRRALPTRARHRTNGRSPAAHGAPGWGQRAGYAGQPPVRRPIRAVGCAAAG